MANTPPEEIGGWHDSRVWRNGDEDAVERRQIAEGAGCGAVAVCWGCGCKWGEEID